MHVYSDRYKAFDMHCHALGDVSHIMNKRRGIGITDVAVFIPPETKYIPLHHKGHYCSISRSENGLMKLVCNDCKCELAEREDLFFEENLALYEECKMITGAHFFALLPVLKGSMQALIDKYIATMPTLTGFKLYTGISDATLDESYFSSVLPLIVHTGTYNNQNPMNMFKFISQYQGNISFAHFARLDMFFLSVTKKLNNVYYDVSPAYEMFMRHKDGRRVFLCSNKDAITDVNYLYRTLLNAVGIEHILWGSDEPYSNLALEYSTFAKSYLSEEEKQIILSENPQAFMSLRINHSNSVNDYKS